MKPQRIYIAYRYSNPPNVIDILANIGVAIKAGVEVAKKGHIPHIPHLDCLIAMYAEGKLSINFYYTLGMMDLQRSDAVLLLNKDDLKLNNGNNGVKREYEWAKINNLPIYYSVEEIPKSNTNFL